MSGTGIDITKWGCRKLRWSLFAVAVGLLQMTAAPARIRHIQYSSDLQDYDLAYDPARLQGFDMTQVIWMSPYYRPSGDVRFEYGATEDGPGRPNKQIGMSLEFTPTPVAAREGAQHQMLPMGKPGSPENWRFLERNLEFGRGEVAELRTMKLPPVLEPVRSYMLFYAERDVKWAEARYQHARTGDSQALRDVVCRFCTCDAIDPARFASVEGIAGTGARLKASDTLTNSMLQCSGARKFPLESWQKFLKLYGIRERNVFKTPL